MFEARAQVKLVHSATVELDPNIDPGFEVARAQWASDEILVLATEAESVILLNDQEIVKTLKSGRSDWDANCLAVDWRSKRIAVGTTRDTIMYDVSKETAVPVFLSYPAISIGFHGANELVIVWLREISYLEYRDNHQTLVRRFTTAGLHGAVVSERGSQIAAIDEKGSLLLFRVTRESIMQQCKVSDVGFTSVLGVNDSGAFLWLNEQAARLLHLSGDCAIREFAHINGESVTTLCISSDQVVFGRKGVLELWNIDKRGMVAEVASMGSAGAMALSPNGRRLAVVTEGTRVEFWNVVGEK